MHHTKSKQDSYFGEFRPPFFGKYWVRVVKFTPCVGSHMYYIFIMGRHMLSWHSSSPSRNSPLLVHLVWAGIASRTCLSFSVRPCSARGSGCPWPRRSPSGRRRTPGAWPWGSRSARRRTRSKNCPPRGGTPRTWLDPGRTEEIQYQATKLRLLGRRFILLVQHLLIRLPYSPIKKVH